MPAVTVASLAELCNGETRGDRTRLIVGARPLESAEPNDLSFVADHKRAALASASQAGCLIVPISFEQPGPWSLIRVDDPRRAFVHALRALYPEQRPAPLIHPTASISPTAEIAPDCYIGPYVTIGDRVTIGQDSTIHAHVTIYPRVRIGSRVILHSGCVIGADGFGFTLSGASYEKFPQVGTVEIEDDVEIGANCCIDRAALGATRIGEGTKLDNLVHIAHNCTIGRHVAIAAQTGLSGSVTVGDYAVIGGQVGIGERAIVESHAIVGGKAGILTGQKIHAGEPVWGIPARPLRQHLKNLATLSKLGELRERKRKQ